MTNCTRRCIERPGESEAKSICDPSKDQQLGERFIVLKFRETVRGDNDFPSAHVAPVPRAYPPMPLYP